MSGNSKRIHIVGRKNSGKTTLVVELVQHFVQQGISVGTIKHTHHHHELDTPGKDSFLHRQAGADVVGILSPGMDAVFFPKSQQDRENEAPANYDRITASMSGCDLLIVEGDSQSTSPKIEVWRAAMHDQPMAIDDDSIRTIITSDRIQTDTPIIDRNNIAAIAQRVLELSTEPE